MLESGSKSWKKRETEEEQNYFHLYKRDVKKKRIMPFPSAVARSYLSNIYLIKIIPLYMLYKENTKIFKAMLKY